MVEYLTIKGKKYPFRFGYYVMKKVQEKTGLAVKEAFKKKREDIELHETILYAGLKAGAFAENEELDLEEEHMPLALDQCFEDYMKAISSDKFFPKDLEGDGEDNLQKAMGKFQDLDEPGEKEMTRKKKSKT